MRISSFTLERDFVLRARKESKTKQMSPESRPQSFKGSLRICVHAMGRYSFKLIVHFFALNIDRNWLLHSKYIKPRGSSTKNWKSNKKMFDLDVLLSYLTAKESCLGRSLFLFFFFLSTFCTHNKNSSSTVLTAEHSRSLSKHPPGTVSAIIVK